MGIVEQFLTNMGMWPKSRMTKAAVDKCNAALHDATTEANGLAEELENLAEHSGDPFADFAYRARRAQIKR